MLALMIFMWMYYERDPEQRLTDARMMLAMACFVLIAAYMVVIVQGYDRTVPSIVCCAIAVALLIGSIGMRWKQPYMFPGQSR